MQQPQPMMPVMPSYPSNITTEQIQKYLDENKKLILAILDNQNLGKLAECAQYQALLQKNLMYLAAIADAQPPTPSMPQQMAPHPSMQQGGFFMQHPQAAAAAAAAAMAQQQQSGLFPQRAQMQFNSPHQLQPQDPQMHHHQLQLQHQAVQAHMGGGLRPNNGGGLYHQMQQHSETTALGGGSKQDPSTDADHHHGQGNSAADRSEEPK